MEKQEFVIKGNVEGILQILKKDFNMPLEEAKFFVYVMVEQRNKDAANIVAQEELDEWYLSKEDRYEGQLLNTHLVVNFTTLTQSMYHEAYIFLVKYFFTRNINIFLIGAELVFIIGRSIKKISDTDYCVFARIVELCIENKDRFFDEGDIIVANKDGKCDYIEDNWICPNLKQDDNCTCNSQKVKLAFEKLEEQNIIKKVGDHWILLR